MFYSQIILAKKGPLGKIWLAAHHGDKKLGRPQIFSTDIGKSVDSIVHPTVPLALRVSGHLLLGVVRIYSRQVKYVLHDCHEAMVQIQMAFAKPHESTNLAQTTTTTANGGEIHIVPHFGEFVEGAASPRKPFVLDHIAGDGFCLPFDLQQMSETELAEQWIVADDPEQESALQQSYVMDADTTINTSMASSTQYQPPEQQWTAFDPDAVMMEEDQEALNQSKVSDIEVARAAVPEDSMTSDVTMRLSSISNINTTTTNPETTKNSALKPPVTPGGISINSDFPVMDDDNILPPDEEDNLPPPMDDDLPPPMDDDPPPPMDDDLPVPMDETDEQVQDISISKDSTTLEVAAANAAAIGLDDTEQTTTTTTHEAHQETQITDVEEPPKKKVKRQSGVLRARKCRKVISDWDDMELTNAHIKAMLRDTSDVVQPHVPHPADWEEEKEVDEMDQLFSWIPKENENTRVLRDYLGHSDRLWSRPCIADDGQLSASLLQVWNHNLSRVHGKDLPIPKEDKPEDVEVARAQDDASASEKEPASANKDPNDDTPPLSPLEDEEDQLPPPMEDEEGLPPPHMEDEDDLPPPPMEDEEDLPPPMEDEDEIPPPPMWDEEDGPSPADTSEVLDLGLVNALDRDLETDEGDDRQTMGSELVSSNSKWHIHTVKVLSLLQRNMGGEDKADHLSYNSLAKRCSRRTASGVFFELLQLKTWDFIDLDQGESYGDITISPGVKFEEEPPTKENQEATNEATASTGSPGTT